MNKFVIATLVGLVLVLTLGTVSFAYAQTPAQTPGVGTGVGMMGGRGPRGGMTAGTAVVGEGILHDYMVAAFAEQLNIPATDLEARLDQGETMAQIATAQGLTVEQFRTLMIAARTQAIDQALNDGKLTQQQADWMKQHGAGQMAAGRMGNGSGNNRGMRGAGQGQFANPGCPYYSQTNP